MPRSLRALALASCLVLAPAALRAQQIADSTFDATVARPAFAKKHPHVAIDAAHNNFHTAAGRYKPLADLLANDGYRVTSLRDTFTRATLKDVDILVVSNARPRMRPVGLDVDSAFTDAECDAVRDWVRRGGSLLLVADHWPMGAAAERLGQRFGVGMSKAFTADSLHYEAAAGGTMELVFSRENGLLGNHPITRGRDSAETIQRVVTFTGQSLLGPAGSEALLELAPSAIDRQPDPADPFEKLAPGGVSAAGRTQGLALAYGKGRVVVLGEAAMLTSQVDRSEPEHPPWGMSYEASDDRQFALNVFHWLSRVL